MESFGQASLGASLSSTHIYLSAHGIVFQTPASFQSLSCQPPAPHARCVETCGRAIEPPRSSSREGRTLIDHCTLTSNRAPGQVDRSHVLLWAPSTVQLSTYQICCCYEDLSLATVFRMDLYFMGSLECIRWRGIELNVICSSSICRHASSALRVGEMLMPIHDTYCGKGGL